VELTDALERPLFGERARLDRRSPALVGSECDACGRRSWPGRSVCERCGSVVTKEVRLGPRGSLLSFTTVYVPRAGIEAPYTLGLIELEQGVRVHAQVRGVEVGAKVPAPVALVIPSDDGPVAFWFEAAL
jgi:uncharacterized protein